MSDESTSQKSNGPFEWLWRRQAIARSRAFRADLSEKSRRRLTRALQAVELAERALDPVDPLRAGPSEGLTLSLYREAAYWAILAQDDAWEASDLATAFGVAPTELLLFAAGSAAELEEVVKTLVHNDFVRIAELHPQEIATQAGVAKAFVAALLRRKLAPEAELSRLFLQRWSRTLGLAGLFVVLLVGGTIAVMQLSKAPDLALGKKWRTSSSTPECNAEERTCNGESTKMLFHTREEQNPWFEIDLGAPASFSEVAIENRSDCCPDRALPLAVQVSDDRTEWREVARRTEPFSNWRAKFAPQTARYVRLEAQRKTILHLESVEVRR